ncbi:2,5-dichloro-2,5-cyclohexadiene-1,4-diol dehydrogenase [Colletotrichum sp. SAR11_59]|nr:2,5-dichloro-2,5-cyclohexadiene-1,4-diol dehydrogenase [Colletotrichum sp. SAR11_59]
MGILEPTLTPFKGKVVTVAGASRGTGLATVKYLVLRGATVSMSSSSPKGIAKAHAEVLEECPGSDDRIMAMACDITKYEDVQAWIAETMKRFGRIDGCANVSGKEQRKLFPLTELPIEDYKEIMDVNVNGLFYLLREQMKVISEGGSIVNVGSVCSSFSSPYYGAYIASKHGAAGLTKAAAFEGAARGVRVNSLNPNPGSGQSYITIDELTVSYHDERRARDNFTHPAYFSMGVDNHKPCKASLNNKCTANLVYKKLSVRIFRMAEHYVGAAIYAEALNSTEVDHDTCAPLQLDENYVACPVDHSEELIRILQSHENQFDTNNRIAGNDFFTVVNERSLPVIYYQEPKPYTFINWFYHNYAINQSLVNFVQCNFFVINRARTAEEKLLAHRSLELAKRGLPGHGFWYDPDEDYTPENRAKFLPEQVDQIGEWHAIKDEIGLDIRGGYMPEYVSHGDADVVGEEMGGSMTSSYIRFGKDVGAIALEGLYGCTSIVIVSQRGAWVSHIWEEQLGDEKSWALLSEKLGPLRKGYHDKAPHDWEYSARDFMMYGLEDMIMKPDLGPEGVLFGDVNENGDDPNQKTPQDISVRAFIFTPKQRPERRVGKEIIPDEELVLPGNLAYEPQVNGLTSIISDIFGEIPIEVVGYQPSSIPSDLFKSWDRRTIEKDRERGGRPATKEEKQEWWAEMEAEAGAWQKRFLAKSTRGKLLLQYQPADPDVCREEATWRLWIEDHEVGDRSDQWTASVDQTFVWKGGSSNSKRSGNESYHALNPLRPRQSNTGCSAMPGHPTPFLCRPETCGGGDGSSCSKPPDRSSASSQELTRRTADLEKRGQTVDGEWPDPEDYEGDRSKFMVAQMAEIRDWEMIGRQRGTAVNGLYEPQYVKHGSRANVSPQFAGITTSKYVLFGKDVASIALEGLYGCTSIIVVSQRGAFVNHVWETVFALPNEWKRDVEDEDSELWKGLYSVLPTSPWRRVVDFAKYGLKDLVGKERIGPPGTMFGDVATPDDDDRDKKSSEDLNTRAFILTPREKPKRVEKSEDGTEWLFVPDEVALPDPINAMDGTIAYEDQVDFLKSMVSSIYGDIDVEVITYSPPLSTLQMLMDKYKKYEERGGKDPQGDELNREIEEFSRYQRETYGPTPRGKLLLQYQPADADDCRDQAAWRLWIEDRELGDRSDQWKASEDQTFVAPKDDESSDGEGAGSGSDGSPVKLRPRQNKVKACPVYQEERCEVSDCGDACPVILWKDVEKPTWMTKRGMPVEGDWPDPEDYPEGRRDRFLINEFQLITTWDPSPNNQDLEFFGGYDPVWVRHGQPEHVGVEMAGMTTSNYVRFDSQVAAITLGGLYGCTAVVVVSQRGAWVSHIWENQIYTQKEFTFLVNDMLPKGIAPGEPGEKWMKFGMNTMVENPDRAPEGVMFGDVKEKDDNTKDDAKSTQDIGTRAYIIAPRVRAERFRNGQLVPESEFLNDLNHNVGQIRYPSQVGKLKQIVRDSLGDIPVETLDYSPQALPNRIVEKYETLRMERVRAGKQETPEEASARRKECRDFQENVARTSVRGKLLIQYHPAKTCNDMASWRLWWENREIGNKYDSWVPESSQIFQIIFQTVNHEFEIDVSHKNPTHFHHNLAFDITAQDINFPGPSNYVDQA